MDIDDGMVSYNSKNFDIYMHARCCLYHEQKENEIFFYVFSEAMMHTYHDETHAFIE